MARLTAPNGAVVVVGDDKVAGLVRRGYTTGKAPAETTTPADKPTSSNKPSGKSGKSGK